MDEAGINKSAILLMSLGEEEAGEVFKHLDPKEVQKLSAAMATTSRRSCWQSAMTRAKCGSISKLGRTAWFW